MKVSTLPIKLTNELQVRSSPGTLRRRERKRRAVNNHSSMILTACHSEIAPFFSSSLNEIEYCEEKEKITLNPKRRRKWETPAFSGDSKRDEAFREKVREEAGPKFSQLEICTPFDNLPVERTGVAAWSGRRGDKSGWGTSRLWLA